METRKHSKYELCERHAPWFAGQGRRRILECMVEGGPGGWSPGCEGGRCRLWPGRDVFEPSVCGGELELEWTRPDPAGAIGAAVDEAHKRRELARERTRTRCRSLRRQAAELEREAGRLERLAGLEATS